MKELFVSFILSQETYRISDADRANEHDYEYCRRRRRRHRRRRSAKPNARSFVNSSSKCIIQIAHNYTNTSRIITVREHQILPLIKGHHGRPSAGRRRGQTTIRFFVSVRFESKISAIGDWRAPIPAHESLATATLSAENVKNQHINGRPTLSHIESVQFRRQRSSLIQHLRYKM